MNHLLVFVFYLLLPSYPTITISQIKQLDDLHWGVQVYSDEGVNPDIYLSMSIDGFILECRMDPLPFIDSSNQPKLWYWCYKNWIALSKCNSTKEQDPDSITITITNRNNIPLKIDVISITTTELTENSAFSLNYFNVKSIDGKLESQENVTLINESMEIQLTDAILNSQSHHVAEISPPSIICSTRETEFIFVQDEAMTQSNAQEHCRNHYDSDLAIIDNIYKGQLASQMMQRTKFKTAWIGLKKYEDGIWRFVDETMCWNTVQDGNCKNDPRWLPGEPNELPGEHCASINLEGGWNDIGCSNVELAVICNFNKNATSRSPTTSPSNMPTVSPSNAPPTEKVNWSLLFAIGMSVMVIFCISTLMIMRRIYRRRESEYVTVKKEEVNHNDTDDEVANEQLQDNCFVVLNVEGVVVDINVSILSPELLTKAGQHNCLMIKKIRSGDNGPTTTNTDSNAPFTSIMSSEAGVNDHMSVEDVNELIRNDL